MKTLKITLLMLAVVVLTVSGSTSDTIAKDEANTYKEAPAYDLLAHAKKKKTLGGQS
ncbi:hypothetical protein [Winogradskyella sp. 3972H.M.0a.05]|uniref:hypothetical protein n=1 Tax=Winogradskyella sp. 3972H.M.0a.05 TaxID=2950277 RepID=UPI003396CB65